MMMAFCPTCDTRIYMNITGKTRKAWLEEHAASKRAWVLCIACREDSLRERLFEWTGDKLYEWLNTANHAFGDELPATLLDDEAGRKRLEQMLDELDAGNLA
jgi:hypothetical protein